MPDDEFIDKRFVTDTGLEVVMIDENTFKIVSSCEILHRIIESHTEEVNNAR